MPARSALIASCLLALGLPASAGAQQPPGAFVSDSFSSSAANGKTAIAFDHTGALLYAEKQGRVMRMSPDGAGGFAAPVEFANFTGSVSTHQEAGLLGLAIDPDYASNRYLYVFYTTASDQRLVRLQANDSFSALQPGPATVLLDGLPRASNIHKGGDIHFSPADPAAIYIALGDDGVRSTRIACPARGGLQIAVPQCPDRYEGKLLKVDAASGQGLASNPFYDGDADSIASRVWGVGFRNPFRFSFHPGRPDTDVLYVSENGDGTDRVSRVRAGSNGGWGPCGDSGACDGPGDVNDGGPFIAPKDPQHKVLLTINPSLVGIELSAGGPFGSDVLYFARYGAAVRRGRLVGADLDALDLLDAGGDFRSGSAVTLRLGPDGHMYYASSGQGASIGGNDPIRRIRFSASTPPEADFATDPDPPQGPAPLNLQFTDLSTAPGSSIATRSWDFGDGLSATGATPTHAYTDPGRYTARLLVTNAAGQAASHSVSVTVTRRVSLDLQGQLHDARSLLAPALGIATEVRLYQDDGTTPAVPVGAPSHALSVPAGGVVDEQIEVDLSGDALVISVGEPAADGLQPIRRGYRLPAGTGPHTLDVDAWLSDTVIAGTVRDTRGVPLEVDVGLRLDGQPHALPNGRDYLPASIPPSGVDHRVVSDALGYFHMALRSADAGTARLDAVADTGSATHANPRFEQPLASGGLWSAELLVGIWDGGRDCSDLSSIAEVPEVDFQADLQPIFNAACIGCHAPGASNSGGLDLTSAASRAALVDAPSGRAPGVRRVAVGDPSRSFLYEKIRCNDPQRGTRMRPADPMPAAQQALFRDWILQLNDPLRIYHDGFEQVP